MIIKIDNGFIERTIKSRLAKLKLSIWPPLFITDITDPGILKLRYALKDPAQA